MLINNESVKGSKWLILVLGGYGNFGQRIVRMLAKEPHWDILVGGRQISHAQALIERIIPEQPKATLTPYVIDWQLANFSQLLQESQANMVIHTAGPFQHQDYRVAQACIELGIHYIDLSDARAFVCGISTLDEQAKHKDVVVVSGASTVPGLSSVIIDHYAKQFGMLREIYYGIVPGNKIERGLGTISAILSYIGKPFERLEKGKWKKVYGWQDLHRHYYGDFIGHRWHANIDIPDLTLFPERYKDLKTCVFHAGLELSFLHITMWMMSWLTRLHIVHSWKAMAKSINAISHWFDRFGSDSSAMSIQMSGSNLQYQPLEITWTLVAENGHGPNVPTVPSVILANKIREGKIIPGARSCLGMFSLEEFDKAIELAHWDIYHTVEEKVM